MVSIISHNPEESAGLGKSWGNNLTAGMLIGLSGELGSGKTQMAKGIALGLGTRQLLTSPSFTLINEIGGARLPIWHLDLYRLKDWEDIVRAGLDAYFFEENGIVIVEWIDRCFGKKGAEAFADWRGRGFRFVKIKIISKTKRQIEYDDFED